MPGLCSSKAFRTKDILTRFPDKKRVLRGLSVSLFGACPENGRFLDMVDEGSAGEEGAEGWSEVTGSDPFPMWVSPVVLVLLHTLSRHPRA